MTSRARILPATIALLALVLVTKSAVLIRTAIFSFQPAAFITSAWASGPLVPPPGELPSAKPKSEPAPEKKPVVAEPPVAEQKPQSPPEPPPVTDAEKAVLMELRQRRKDLETREATIAARESMLAAAEMKLSERVGELQALQSKLESLDASHRQQEDTAWQGLVKVYETMKPRDAAAIFNDLGMQVLLAVIERMKEAKAAAVLAAMSPDRAREVTMQLALARSKAAGPVETGTKPPAAEPGKAPGSGT
jgi:flagellar motility protein MotE (MotC chaperone)